MLMYAYDLVILASTHSRLQRSLNILLEYYTVNGLTVNVDKTKTLTTSHNGLKRNKRPFTYNSNQIESVRNFTYLGVNFSVLALRKSAVEEVTRIGKISSSSILNILHEERGDSWLGKLKLHQSTIRDTLSYMAHLWCLKPENLEILDSANLFFFKRLFLLPRCIPGYAIRLELNLHQLAVAVLKAALK